MLTRWYHNFYCSIFTYYSHSWAYGGRAAHLWGVVILSLIPTLGYWSIILLVYPPGSATPEFFDMFAGLPGFLRKGWIYIVLLIVNGRYFLSRGLWIGIVDEFKALSFRQRQFRHVVCALTVGANVVFLLYLVFTIDSP